MRQMSKVPTLGILILAGCAVLAGNTIASAQFGGYQEMTLDKIRRQQAADAQQLGRGPRGGSVQTPVVPNITRNYFISPYGYDYFYNPYWGGQFAPGYGYYGNWPLTPYYSAVQPAPIFVQPQVQVNPVIVQPPAAQQAPGRANQPLPGVNAMAAPRRAGPAAPEDEIVRRVSVLKPSNEAGRTRADRLIAEGDREFAAQQYRRAASKYREAIGRAPDYAAAHLRAGHAYIATRDYELAVTYFAMGFELARTVDRAGFSLESLYRGDRLAKEEHLESLADAMLRQPRDGGLLFLTGLVLHYDGKPLQARDYFRRASEMSGRHHPYAEMFLPASAALPEQAAADDPPPPPQP
jgi:hypothetical protein